MTKREVPSSDIGVAQMQSHHFEKNVHNAVNSNAGLSYEDVLNEDFQFDMDAHDVMVFLHIQKTGGTSFGKHLVRDLDLKVNFVALLSKETGQYHLSDFSETMRMPAET